MAELVMFAVAAVVALQIPVAIVVHVDAKRLGLANPEMYELGILVPTAGIAVALVYFSRRRDLPRADDET